MTENAQVKYFRRMNDRFVESDNSAEPTLADDGFATTAIDRVMKDSNGLLLHIWPVKDENQFCEQHLSIQGILLEAKVNEFYQAHSEQQIKLSFISEDADSIVESLRQQLSKGGLNYAIRQQNSVTIKPRLLVFDMDSTLIQMECIDELARQCGFYQQVAEITELAMQGKLDFSQSLKQRVALLKDLPLKEVTALASNLPVTPGVVDVVAWAKQNDAKIAVVSGGFTPFVNALKDQLQLDYAFANELEKTSSHLTGKLIGNIVDGEQKKEILKSLQKQLGLSTDEVWAIGDGANDLAMMSSAGLGVAFDAKPAVKEQASAAIVKPDMRELLKLLSVE